MFRKYYVLWDAPEGVNPPHVLPLALSKTQFKNEDEYEAECFSRLAALGGYPVVGFVEHEDNKDQPFAPQE